MKRFTAISLALVLALGTLTACGSDEAATTPAATDSQTSTAAASTDAAATEEDAVDPADWATFDTLIKEIKSTTDYAEREAMMHEAEDILMDTGCIVPIYYYNDPYMVKSYVKGVYGTVEGMKYFYHATIEQ